MIIKIASELINTDAKFEDVARRTSEDEATKENGGVLGWIEYDDLPKPFFKMAHQLKPGEMSPPVETEQGWHLILRRG